MAGTAARVNGLIDAIIARIEAGGGPLGILAVDERDEIPAYVDPGTCFVIPLVEGKDVMRTPIGGGSLEHQFSVTIVAYYRYDDIAAGLRPTRDAGYGVLDLFFGDHDRETIEAVVGEEALQAYPYDPVLEVGYARITDYVLHWFIATIKLKVVI